MSDAEYAYMVGAVYKSWMASIVAKENQGKQVSQLVEEAQAATAEAQARTAEALKDHQKELDEQLKNLPSEAPNAEAVQKALTEGVAAFQQQEQGARELAKSLDVPPANIELFRKYQADIEKYSLRGLEMLGF